MKQWTKGKGQFLIRTLDGTFVARTRITPHSYRPGDDERDEKNATMIASLPDLYNVAQEMARVLESHRGTAEVSNALINYYEIAGEFE